jgi:hypothetical protein
MKSSKSSPKAKKNSPPKQQANVQSAKQRIMEAGSHNEGRMSYSTSRQAC